jgi:hypothetical protein
MGQLALSGEAGRPLNRVEASVSTVPTDQPEGDGTLAWDSTTLVLASTRRGCRGPRLHLRCCGHRRGHHDASGAGRHGQNALDVPRRACSSYR